MSRARHFGPPLATLIFAILAFSFSVVTITSREWAVRDNFDPDFAAQYWDKPIYTLHRSPFIICTATQHNSTNSTAAPTYDIHCDHYKPFGFDKTSCESNNATGSDHATNLGDQRLCQQIHLAGNYAITSTVFIGVGFLATIALVLLSFSRSLSTHRHDRQDYESGRKSIGGFLPLLTLITLAFLFIGFVTALISQFYGIMGFMVSLPNQSDYASSQGSGGSDETDVHGSHGPWYQGKALSLYATLSWGFTIATGTMVSLTWRLPRWHV